MVSLSNLLNILDKILALENIPIGFVLVEAKQKTVLYGRTFASRLSSYAPSDEATS